MPCGALPAEPRKDFTKLADKLEPGVILQTNAMFVLGYSRGFISHLSICGHMDSKDKFMGVFWYTVVIVVI